MTLSYLFASESFLFRYFILEFSIVSSLLGQSPDPGKFTSSRSLYQIARLVAFSCPNPLVTFTGYVATDTRQSRNVRHQRPLHSVLSTSEMPAGSLQLFRHLDHVLHPFSHFSDQWQATLLDSNKLTFYPTPFEPFDPPVAAVTPLRL